MLIITYIFPPFPSVGGRRWLKFAKYLGKKGVAVHVLHAKNPLNEISPWTDELPNLINVTLHPVAATYPTLLFGPTRFLYQRIAYRFLSCVLKRFHRGQVFDWALLWKREMLMNAEKIIRDHGIDTVITTAPPFHALHHALTLKNIFPGLNLISDFRDPWTERLLAHGVSEKRVAYEVTWEKSVLEQSTVVLTVSDAMTQRLGEKVGLEHRKKIRTIPNGFDLDDLGDTPINREPSQKTIRLIHTGELYGGMPYLVDPFFRAIEEMQTTHPDLFRSLRVDFFGEINSSYPLPKVLQSHPSLARGNLPKHVHQADAGIVFLPDYMDFAFPTKFVEYLGFQKPILVVSRRGYTSKFVEEEHIGYWLDPTNMLKTFTDALSSLRGNDPLLWNNFDNGRFSIPRITDNLLEIIQNP